MDTSIIVAVAENGTIGRDNAMPWKLSTDLKRFKAITLSKPVIMGRKTWVSIGRPLPGRTNIIITREKGFKVEGAVVAHTLSQALQLAQEDAQVKGIDEIFIIGGGEIFKNAMPLVTKMYVTEILNPIDGDTFFPPFDAHSWQTLSTEMVPAGEKDSHATRFVIYKRVGMPKSA